MNEGELESSLLDPAGNGPKRKSAAPVYLTGLPRWPQAVEPEQPS